MLEHNIPIDTKYYLENQLSKPLLRIFEPVIKHADELLGIVFLSFWHSRRPYKNHSCSGPHTWRIEEICCQDRVLSWMQGPACERRLCRCLHLFVEKLVCKFCRPELPKFYLKHVDMLKQTEIKFNRLWTQCQRCQGSLHQDVLCTSKDCPIFYMRKKAQKEVKEVSDLMEKFEFDW